jgi:putative acetyltransferase
MLIIRKEQSGDHKAIHALNLASFENGPEADLVDKLRISCDAYLAFVAVENESVVGHILFTPVTIKNSEHAGMGLAPMAVLPPHQGKGIGSKLVRHGLEYLSKQGCPFVIVLGHPGYYPRFGFEPAIKWGIHSTYDVPENAFMAIELLSGSLDGVSGTVEYPKEFEDIS